MLLMVNLKHHNKVGYMSFRCQKYKGKELTCFKTCYLVRSKGSDNLMPAVEVMYYSRMTYENTDRYTKQYCRT